MRLSRAAAKERIREAIEDTLDAQHFNRLTGKVDIYNTPADVDELTDAVWEILGELDTTDLGLDEEEVD